MKLRPPWLGKGVGNAGNGCIIGFQAYSLKLPDGGLEGEGMCDFNGGHFLTLPAEAFVFSPEQSIQQSSPASD